MGALRRHGGVQHEQFRRPSMPISAGNIKVEPASE
jgi:hypothetical protein